jgi:hypothetical protein
MEVIRGSGRWLPIDIPWALDCESLVILAVLEVSVGLSSVTVLAGVHPLIFGPHRVEWLWASDVSASLTS